MAELPTYGAEAWIIWIWPGGHFGRLPFLILGSVYVTSTLVNYIHLRKKMGDRDPCICRNLEGNSGILCVKLAKYSEMSALLSSLILS